MELGDIYALGSHRLMCGDATKKEDVLKLVGNERVNLVLTDPPYGISVQNKQGTYSGANKIRHDDGSVKIYHSPIYPRMINDDNTQCARDNYFIVSDLCDRIIMWGANNFCDVLPLSNGWLVWDKNIRLKNSFGHGELAWTNVCKSLKIYTHEWSGCFRAGSHKLNPIPRVHVCQKPVELIMSILQDFSKEWDIVLDCFAGSGTTLIACEMTGRKCLTMEISPEYCEIICNRFEKLTGIKPVKL